MTANVPSDSVEFNQTNFPEILESLVAAYKEEEFDVLSQGGFEGMDM